MNRSQFHGITKRESGEPSNSIPLHSLISPPLCDCQVDRIHRLGLAPSVEW
jgi:hypothetical protein